MKKMPPEVQKRLMDAIMKRKNQREVQKDQTLDIIHMVQVQK